MDENQRLAASLDQLTKRVDDLSMRVVVVENNQEHLDEKMAELKTLIIEKHTEVRDSIKTWNRIGLWLLGSFGLVFIAAVANFIIAGGLAA